MRSNFFILRRLWDTRHSAVNSLAPRRRSGERVRERGNPINTALLSLALSSLGGGEGNLRRRFICSLSRRFISNVILSFHALNLAPPVSCSKYLVALVSIPAAFACHFVPGSKREKAARSVQSRNKESAATSSGNPTNPAPLARKM